MADDLLAYETEVVARLDDPAWRIRNLYWITDKDGREVKFTPWPEQEKLLTNLWFRNIILKARHGDSQR